jgi:acetyltransferase-like isoleucine patch superfamily enzyme
LRRLSFVGHGVKLIGARRLVLGRFVTIEDYATVDGYCREPLTIGDRTKIGAYTTISCTSHLSSVGVGLRIGNDCGISEYSYFGAAGGIDIGNDVIMGQYVSFHSQNHVFEESDRLIREQGVTAKGIKVGNNVWIGAKATFLDGSEVGDNSVVAAGAVVNGRFGPNVVLAGVPARVVKALTADTASAEERSPNQ